MTAAEMPNCLVVVMEQLAQGRVQVGVAACSQSDQGVHDADAGRC